MKTQLLYDNMQDCFNAAWNGVIAQGRTNRNADEDCLYGSPDNLTTACGVGHCIPPEDRYKIDVLMAEGAEHPNSTVGRLHVMGILDTRGVDIAFLSSLQNAHDTVNDGHDFLREFRMNMRNVARRFKLEFPDV